MRQLNDLRFLIDETKNCFTKLTLECTVTTGFEQTARNECLQKLGEKIKVGTSRGRVFFNTKYDSYHKFQELRSVDHVYVVAGFTNVSLGGQPEHKVNDLEKIKGTTNSFEWDKVLTVWKEVAEFEGNLYPTRKEYERAVEKTTLVRNGMSDTEDEIEFQCKDIHYKKTELEKALDEAVSCSDDESHSDNSNNCAKVVDNRIPKFRVTCNRVGQNHSFTSQEAATVFGGHLQDKFNWIVDLSNYDIEIILEINNEDIYAGIVLNKELNHLRNLKYLGPTTMRATICFNMLMLCDIKPGEIVIDPMCGSGSIPIEGSIAFQNAYFVGGDNHKLAVKRTRKNITALNKSSLIDNVRWDSTHLPLKTNSVDVFVSDFPFGKRIGSKSNNKGLYKQALNELARVLRLKTGRCVILTADTTSLNLAFHQTKPFWKQTKHLYINMGGISISCFVFQRTEEEFYVKLSRKERMYLKFKQRLLEREAQKLKGEMNYICSYKGVIRYD
ncbi:hypothetical protein RUM44_002159 [Polyplax serrata]|uniref:THUMP domain-containing protein n=1 Tax=Polyplax serrata TaxID=468196 RepID=A0ABR1AM34_POLSC